MTRKKQYAEFLRTDFWQEMTARKKALMGKCERCGSVDQLQSHHRFYREDWFETKMEDLEVLCEGCHRKEHGLAGKECSMMVYRGDFRFSKFIHWIGYLNDRMVRLGAGGLLKGRERWYLARALDAYPPEPKDRCMKFHVKNCLRWNRKARNY